MIEKAKLVAIFGAENVIDEPGVLEEYASDMSFMARMMPDYVVRPKNTEQIRSLVSLARETQTPLIPVSSGAPHLRGDTVPTAGGAIIVDLSTMKKIIRVDRTNRVCMFEPGVTFTELIPACTKEKLRLNIPLLPRATKSVTASMLEREPVIIPKYHWDIADPLNCVEIIFGTGDMFRTGAAAGPGSLEEQWAAGGAQVEAAGPSSASWYRVIGGSQGTMGIVTWSSARCELLPSLEEPFFVGSDDLSRLMEMVHWLVRLTIPNECFILNNASVAAIMAKKWPDDYTRIKDALPMWVLFYNLAGFDYYPEERIATHREDVKEIEQRTFVESTRSLGKISAFEFLKVVQAPSSEPYWKLRAKGACHDVMCIANFQGVERVVRKMIHLAADAGYATPDMGIYIQPVVQGVNYHVEFNLFYDRNSRRETERVRGLATNCINPLMAEGAFFSRPYGDVARLILNRDAATVMALNRVKAIVDPAGIMNPGKLCF
ncbi:MAG: FAD-binding oxidoreductase [Dehalococcoidales bacterium]|nr:FAD-binding oxidoreductase [Dehalococcoidales bacterium]